MNKAEQSSPRPSCQSWLRAPCQNVNVYITPAAHPIPSDENKEKSSATKEVIPPPTTEVINPPPLTEVTTPSPFTNPINTNTSYDPPRNTEWECVDPIYGSHNGPHYARPNGPHYEPHYAHHSLLLPSNQLQRMFSSDGNPTSDYPEYDDSQSSESFELNPSPIERCPFDAFTLHSDLELHEHCHYFFYVAFAVFAIWFIFTFVIGFDGNNGTLSSFCHKYTKPY
ncbi:uncharacterized protein LOC123291575 [Chrysoperla carnea]|uniref:uncharacterized protein LOC123291575 n=1 Tax=Chrysoperla carnea TaxID=189513 RepID=UPI001D0723EB|nr:uncharacterized protein LOC123291575 [Chrysoperla carnea]